MKNKNKAQIISIFLSIVMLAGVIHFNKDVILVFAIGTPDAYGNRIQQLTVEQLNGAWAQVGDTYTYSNYTYPTGFSISCSSNKNTRFNVTVYINNTFASSAADAVTKTRVYITIATGGYEGTPESGWNSRLMDDGHTEGSTGSYYWVKLYESWTTAGRPAAGTVYYVTIDYDAWY